jgi:hypothetical protein
MYGKLQCFYDRPFQPSQMCMSTVLHSKIGSLPYPQTLDTTFVNYSCEKFYSKGLRSSVTRKKLKEIDISKFLGSVNVETIIGPVQLNFFTAVTVIS